MKHWFQHQLRLEKLRSPAANGVCEDVFLPRLVNSTQIGKLKVRVFHHLFSENIGADSTKNQN